MTDFENIFVCLKSMCSESYIDSDADDLNGIPDLLNLCKYQWIIINN